MIRRVKNKFYQLASVDSQITALSDKIEGLSNNIEELRRKIDRLDVVSTVYLPKGEVMIRIFSGAKMFLHLSDRGLVPHLITDGEWEHDVTQAWLRTVTPRDIVMDIGANFGYFSVLAVQQTNKQCKVVLFEANPKLIPYLNDTINVNSFSDVVSIENMAVSNNDEDIKLNVLKDYIASSSVLDINKINNASAVNKYMVEEEVTVPATTIDHYSTKKHIESVDLIKMDIEGYEDVAYEGMRKTIKRSPRATMFIEFTPESYKNPKRFFNLLMKDFGNVYSINPDGALKKIKSGKYEDVIRPDSDWTMPVFSKRSDLK